jgi:hypothetical protein
MRLAQRLLLGALCGALLLIGACGKSSSGPDKNDAKDSGAAAQGKAEERKSEPGTVTLKPEQIQSIGLTTAPVSAAEHRAETVGYAVVLSHDVIAQAVAELRTAQAAARQSRAALERARSLTGSPGAVSADVLDTAVRQSSVDDASVALAERKLALIVGTQPPWPSAVRETVLEKLAAARIKLVRMTFPLGALSGESPASLRVTALAAPQGERGSTLSPVWGAPADASVPGRSFFAVLDEDGVAEGDRLDAYAPVGTQRSGLEVPANAVVMSDGKFWCYIERMPGTYVRVEIPVNEPTAQGYFVRTGVHAGDKVVTTAAGWLLAQESNTGEEPD